MQLTRIELMQLANVSLQPCKFEYDEILSGALNNISEKGP